jgi:hypothetical protein
MAEEKKPIRQQVHVNFKGEVLKTLNRIRRATLESSVRRVIITAIYRYEADLIDQGKIVPRDVEHSQ